MASSVSFDSQAIPRPKILVVDDHPANLVAFRRILSQVDAEVITANSGDEALALTLDHELALILLDVQMPDLDGYEVAELLQGAEHSRKTPIIFVTAAYKDEVHRLHGYRAGAVDYIEKPINDLVLLSKVRVFLELHQSQRTLNHLLKELEGVNLQLRAEVEQRKHSEADATRLTHSIFENANEGMVVCDAQNRILAVNHSFQRVTGYTLEQVLGQDPKLLKSGRHDRYFYQEMWQQLQELGRWQGEIWNRRASGELYVEWLSISVIHDEQGTPYRYVAIFSDITSRKEVEAMTWRQANYDALTGLPNRQMFMNHLAQSLNEARRNRDSLALLFVDLDQFKLVNDSLGHATGDELLQRVSQRLTGCVRASDIVARLGGDEFTVLLRGIRSHSSVVHLAKSIVDALSAPFEIQGHEVNSGCSVGITLYPEDATDAQSLLRNADMAMYRAKTERGAFAFFTLEMDQQLQAMVRLSAELRVAFQQHQLQVYYQPILEARTLRLVGAEALVRWHHPERGPISPGEFIPIAESTGYIVTLGTWILEQACQEAASWRDAGLQDLQISVNISNKQLRNEHFYGQLMGALLNSGLTPHALHLEITESLIIEENHQILSLLNRLRELGVGLAIDDFGKGYSALSYLRRFPINILKIDSSFISEITSRPEDAVLVKTIIGLGHNLHIHVVAEGVETLAQLEFLQEAGCDLIQGYYLGRPMPAETFLPWALKQQAWPATEDGSDHFTPGQAPSLP